MENYDISDSSNSTESNKIYKTTEAQRRAVKKYFEKNGQYKYNKDSIKRYRDKLKLRPDYRPRNTYENCVELSIKRLFGINYLI